LLEHRSGPPRAWRAARRGGYHGLARFWATTQDRKSSQPCAWRRKRSTPPAAAFWLAPRAVSRGGTR